jgi:hypothetical protein
VQVEFSRSDAGLYLDLEYVATHTGEYFVHIGMPRVNPMPVGPYVLTIELTPP